MLKFTNNLSSKRFVLAFDLAKITTGWALFDLQSEKIEDFGLLVNNEKEENFWASCYEKFYNFLADLCQKYPSDQIVVTKEQCPNQAGARSSIQALQALYAIHAVVDTVCSQIGIACYDYTGIHVSTVRAFFRKVSGIDSPQKEDVKNVIEQKFPDFNIGDYSLDVTDAIGVAVTFVYSKYNADIKQHIKELKKELKEAKAQKKIDRLQKEIEYISKLTFDIKEW